METDILLIGSTVKKPHLIKNGIRIQCNTENFVPIVVPGVSSSSSSCSHPSTSMTSSRQESNHPASSSSPSTSPTTTVSIDSETRERKDLSGIDSHPVLVSTSHVERTERGDTLTKPTKNAKPNKNENHETERGDPLCAEIRESDGYWWSGWRLTRKQLTSRPDHLWPELWIKYGRNAKLKDKQKWSNEKHHLEDARKLRGIYFIDPEDKEFKVTIKNARKKLETPSDSRYVLQDLQEQSKLGDTW